MNNKKWRVGIVGAGLVGEELEKILHERRFPMESLVFFSRTLDVRTINGRKYTIREINERSFRNIDLVLLAGPEGEQGVAQRYRRFMENAGCIIIDNGSDYRLADDVPLIIPEINGHTLDKWDGQFIASPNCTTTIVLMVLAPLHLELGLKSVVASTYQAWSGAGRTALAGFYNNPGLGKAIPVIGSVLETGETTEEIKMREESRKILGSPHLVVSASCVRVPVGNGHGAALDIEFKKTPSLGEVREVLDLAWGVSLDGGESCPDAVAVSRLRWCPARDNVLKCWIQGDNLRKGAALNVVQIAEEVIKRRQPK